MKIKQAAEELLQTLDALYINDFGGYQCNGDEAADIDAARTKLEEALAEPVVHEFSCSQCGHT